MELRDRDVSFFSFSEAVASLNVTSEDKDPADIVMRFMMENEECEFFIDEFPISYRKTIHDEEFLNYLKKRAKNRPGQFIWITFRLTEVNTDFYRNYIHGH